MRRHLLLAAVALLAVSCATPGSGRSGEGNPAGNGTLLDAGGAQRVPPGRQPTEDELASAFDAPASSARPRTDGPGNVPPWAPPPDPLEQDRAQFEAAVQSLRAQLKSRQPEALAQAAALVARARPLGPVHEQRALELQVAAAIAAKDKASIARIALAWLRACGPDGAEACRRKALSQLNRSVKDAPDAARLKKQLSPIAEADACLRRAEGGAGKGSLPDCLAQAERDYRRLDDDRMVARIQLARARAQASKPSTLDEAARGFERVARACAAPRCLDLQRAAMQQLAQLHLRRNDLEGAARAALRDVALNAASLGAGQRPWAWTELATRTCLLLDEARGEGRCRKLEAQLSGGHSFRDFSIGSAPDEGLSPEIVREVNAHFGFTLQPCLTEQAARLVPPAEERYEVRWTVRNDGRVIEMNMGRRDREQSPLARCLREKLGAWRYPRYVGEYQHVEQLFVVTARAPLRAQ